MSNLANQFISSSYQSVLNVGSSAGDYLTATLKPITDGFGTVSPISLSTNQVGINGTVYVTGSIIPQGSGSWSLGSPTNPFLHGYFSSQSIYLDGHPILQLDETNNTTIKGPGENSIVFLNNITLDSDPTAQTYVGGTFTLVGRGIAETTTNTLYDGDRHWTRTNGNMVFQNVTGNTDTTSSGSYAIGILNGGEYNIYSDSGSIKLATDEGSISFIVQDNVTNQNKKYINLNGAAIAIVSQDGNDIGINNTVSGSIFIDTRNYESGSEVYRGNVLIFGNEILNNGTIINEGSLTTVGNGLYNQIQADYSGSGVQFGGWTLNVSSSVDGTFAGNVLSDLNSGSFNYAPSLGYAVSSFQSETPGMVVPVYYSGDINDAGSDVLMISSGGTTTIYRNVDISGSLHQSGTFYADAITFTNSTSIVETTGSYIMTYDVTGAVTYDTYPNVAAALQPYLSGGTGSYPTVIEASAIQSTGSISIWAEGGNIDVTGSIKTNGAIIWDTNAFNYLNVPSGALYFSTLSGGTLHLNDDGGEGDVYIGWGPQNVNIHANTNITGSFNVGGDSSGIGIYVPDLSINSANYDYPNFNLFVSESLAPNIFAGYGITGNETQDFFGFAASTYNEATQALTYNFYGPGVGNHIVNDVNDNVVFQMEPTGSAVNWYRDTVWNGTLKSTKGFGQVELLSNQTLGSSSDTVITFNNDEFDPSGWYNNEYFYYQPNIAGIYQISYSITFEPATAGTGQINVQVSKDNGMDISQLAINQHELNLLSNTTLTGTVFAQLDGDLDKVYLTAYSSVGQDVNGGNGTYLNIKLL